MRGVRAMRVGQASFCGDSAFGMHVATPLTSAGHHTVCTACSKAAVPCHAASLCRDVHPQRAHSETLSECVKACISHPLPTIVVPTGTAHVDLQCAHACHVLNQTLSMTRSLESALNHTQD